MDAKLAQEFENGLRDLYHTIVTETKYKPTLLAHMMNEHGGLQTAKILIQKDKPSDGYLKLWELRRLDLTIEAFVLNNPQWNELFTPQELEKAKMRIDQLK